MPDHRCPDCEDLAPAEEEMRKRAVNISDRAAAKADRLFVDQLDRRINERQQYR
jgi:hypothetical protein